MGYQASPSPTLQLKRMGGMVVVARTKWVNSYLIITLLKVPKCEIFHRSDFHDFCPIKSLWEDDFGVKIKCFKKKYLGAHLGPQSSLRICSV